MTGVPDGERRGTDRQPSLWRNRDFRRFFAGQFVTNVGDSLYSVAVLWLVFQRSGSTLLTGVANFLLLLPFLLQAAAGPLVDRFPVKPILVGTQFLQGAVVLVFPLAASTGRMSVALVLATVPVLSALALLFAPVPATLLPRIVADENLSRGNSALATVTYGLDMVFDALGGLFIAVFGTAALFLLDSVTFAVAGLLFLGVTVPTVDGGGTADGSGFDAYLADLRAGVDALRGTAFVEMVAVSAVFNLALGVALAVLPAFGDALGGPAVYGLMLGALGVGRVVGSAVAAPLEELPYGRLKAATYAGSAVLWLTAVVAPSVTVTVVAFCLAWVSAGADAVLVETLNQRVFPADLLGRVSALKGTASLATLPVGSLAGGLVGEWLGPTTTMALAASGFGFAGVWFAARRELRRLPAVVDAEPAAFGVRLDARQSTAVDRE